MGNEYIFIEKFRKIYSFTEISYEHHDHIKLLHFLIEITDNICM